MSDEREIPTETPLSTPDQIGQHLTDFYLRDPEEFYVFALGQMIIAGRGDFLGITLRGAAELSRSNLHRLINRPRIEQSYRDGVCFGYLYYAGVAGIDHQPLPYLTPELEAVIWAESHQEARKEMVIENILPNPTPAKFWKKMSQYQAIPEPLRSGWRTIITSSPRYIGKQHSAVAFTQGLRQADLILRRPIEGR